MDDRVKWALLLKHLFEISCLSNVNVQWRIISRVMINSRKIPLHVRIPSEKFLTHVIVDANNSVPQRIKILYCCATNQPITACYQDFHIFVHLSGITSLESILSVANQRSGATVRCSAQFRSPSHAPHQPKELL